MLYRSISIPLILAIAMLGGCASYPTEKASQVGALPDMSGFSQRPTVYIDARVFSGSPDSKVAPAPNKPASKLFEKTAEDVTKNSTLFDSYTFDKAKAADADYTVELRLLNYGDRGAAAVSGFLTGFTLGVIPGAATDNYRLTATVTDKSGKEVGRYVTEDSVKTWMGIWFLPVMGSHSPGEVVPHVWENMVKAAYKQMSEDRAMRYAFGANAERLAWLAM